MNDVEIQAQERGYLDGKNYAPSSPEKYDYHKYDNLNAAYQRGWKVGVEERQINEALILGSQDAEKREPCSPEKYGLKNNLQAAYERGWKAVSNTSNT